MPREVEGYRENIAFLSEKGLPGLMTQKQAAEELGISTKHLRDLIKDGYIKTVGTLVPLGAVARLLCG